MATATCPNVSSDRPVEGVGEWVGGWVEGVEGVSGWVSGWMERMGG